MFSAHKGKEQNNATVSGPQKCPGKISTSFRQPLQPLAVLNPDCDASSECYDEELDPKGETYNGCACKTRTGKTCLVIMFSK